MAPNPTVILASTEYPRSTVAAMLATPSVSVEEEEEEGGDSKVEENEESIGLLIVSIILMVVLCCLFSYGMYREKLLRDEPDQEPVVVM
jgi:hypothetical protein